MFLCGLWTLVGLHSPASPAASTQLVLSLAVVAAALLIVVAAAGLRILPLPVAFCSRGSGQRVRITRLPRLLDPDAAGRPRPRAPTSAPAALSFPV